MSNDWRRGSLLKVRYEMSAKIFFSVFFFRLGTYASLCWRAYCMHFEAEKL